MTRRKKKHKLIVVYYLPIGENFMKRKFFVPFVLACALMSSCASQTVIEPIPFDDSLTIELDSTALQLEIGGSATINAVVSDDEVAVTWVNSDSNVIAVAPHDRFATITAKSTGTAYVTALAAGKSQYCTVTVGSGGETIVVSTITLDQNDVTLDIKETLTLTATVTHEGSQPITWVSSNEAVATVAKQDNRKALVTPKAVGETVITAVSGNKTATCNVKVENFEDDTLAIKADITPTYERMATGAFGLDYPLYGGLVYGRITTFAGREHSGKTSAACLALGAYQRANPDKVCVYVDVEHSLDLKFQMRMNGIDPDRLVYFNPKTLTGEQVLDSILEFQKSDDVGMIVLDSIPALLPAQSMENDIEKDPGMRGTIAKPLHRFLIAMSNLVNQKNNILLLI